MSTKAELKLLHRRVRKLRDYLESVRAALEQASGAELVVAVTMGTRIMNMVVSTFDVGVLEGVATYDINSRVVRLRRDEREELQNVRRRVLDVYTQMLTNLDARVNEVAKAAA